MTPDTAGTDDDALDGTGLGPRNVEALSRAARRGNATAHFYLRLHLHNEGHEAEALTHLARAADTGYPHAAAFLDTELPHAVRALGFRGQLAVRYWRTRVKVINLRCYLGYRFGITAGWKPRQGWATDTAHAVTGLVALKYVGDVCRKPLESFLQNASDDAYKALKAGLRRLRRGEVVLIPIRNTGARLQVEKGGVTRDMSRILAEQAADEDAATLLFAPEPDGQPAIIAWDPGNGIWARQTPDDDQDATGGQPRRRGIPADGRRPGHAGENLHPADVVEAAHTRRPGRGRRTDPDSADA